MLRSRRVPRPLRTHAARILRNAVVRVSLRDFQYAETQALYGRQSMLQRNERSGLHVRGLNSKNSVRIIFRLRQYGLNQRRSGRHGRKVAWDPPAMLGCSKSGSNEPLICIVAKRCFGIWPLSLASRQGLLITSDDFDDVCKKTSGCSKSSRLKPIPSNVTV